MVTIEEALQASEEESLEMTVPFEFKHEYKYSTEQYYVDGEGKTLEYYKQQLKSAKEE